MIKEYIDYEYLTLRYPQPSTKITTIEEWLNIFFIYNIDTYVDNKELIETLVTVGVVNTEKFNPINTFKYEPFYSRGTEIAPVEIVRDLISNLELHINNMKDIDKVNSVLNVFKSYDTKIDWYDLKHYLYMAFTDRTDINTIEILNRIISILVLTKINSNIFKQRHIYRYDKSYTKEYIASLIKGKIPEKLRISPGTSTKILLTNEYFIETILDIFNIREALAEETKLWLEHKNSINNDTILTTRIPYREDILINTIVKMDNSLDREEAESYLNYLLYSVENSMIMSNINWN